MSTLKEIFNATNALEFEFGPFKVVRSKNSDLSDWRDVQCFVGGQPIQLERKLKQFLSAMILSPDHILSTDTLNELEISAKPRDYKDAANILKAQIYNLKKAITEQTGNSEFAKHFQSINPVFRHGQSGIHGKAKGYVLLEILPQLQEDFNQEGSFKIKHGAFEITKDTKFWQEAVFRVNGVEIPLQTLIEKQIIALMIGKINHTATFDDYAHQIKRSGAIKMYPDHLWNLMDQLKFTITSHAGKEFAEQIQPIYLSSRPGSSIVGYRLIVNGTSADLSHTPTAPFKTLSEIFRETDTVEFGPFRIIKHPDRSWREAWVLIGGDPFAFKPEQKKILAALAGQPNQTLLAGHYAEVMEKEPSSPAKILDLMTTHISLIKTQLQSQSGENYAKLICPTNPVGNYGVQVDASERGYYLRQDFGAATEDLDVLKWDVFCMTKFKTENWNASRVYKDGIEIDLSPSTKDFLALMLQKEDHSLTIGEVQAFYKARGEDVSLETAETSIKSRMKMLRSQFGGQVNPIGGRGRWGLPLKYRGYCLKASDAPEQHIS